MTTEQKTIALHNLAAMVTNDPSMQTTTRAMNLLEVLNEGDGDNFPAALADAQALAEQERAAQ